MNRLLESVGDSSLDKAWSVLPAVPEGTIVGRVL